MVQVVAVSMGGTGEVELEKVKKLLAVQKIPQHNLFERVPAPDPAANKKYLSSTNASSKGGGTGGEGGLGGLNEADWGRGGLVDWGREPMVLVVC